MGQQMTMSTEQVTECGGLVSLTASLPNIYQWTLHSWAKETGGTSHAKIVCAGFWLQTHRLACKLNPNFSIISRFFLTPSPIYSKEHGKDLWSGPPTNKIRSPNVGLVLAQRRRRWSNINLTLDVACVLGEGGQPWWGFRQLQKKVQSFVLDNNQMKNVCFQFSKTI